MGVTVTARAAKQIRKALDKRGSGFGLRVAVKTSGCSGYAYALEFADAPLPDELRDRYAALVTERAALLSE